MSLNLPGKQLNTLGTSIKTALTSNKLETAQYMDDSVTFDKIENVATDKLLARVSSGEGSIEEVTFTDKAQELLEQPTAAEMRTVLGITAGDALTTNPLSQFAATTSAQLAGVISDETGSGALVFANSPILVTPVLGTPASGTLTNCTIPASGVTGVGGVKVVFKASDETVNNSSTLQDDNELIFPVLANKVYRLSLWLYFTWSFDVSKIGFSVPSGTTMRYGRDSSGFSSESDTVNMLNDGGSELNVINCTIITSSTAGNVTLQWAQKTADMSDNILLAKSHGILTQIA